ncbi:GNAT family N-acetyltransferase [Nocardioides flavescens]|uniref:GNAT family N-acetyltransferase n=1 Tax=Nocardioides flavescens TaxID=2691959 RepID=A0A6L7EX40_9ACTN|nr:GNAT family N-acetyltransferase [Nocardioides flavescens]
MAEVRAATPGDHRAVGELVAAAFGEEEGPTVAALVEALRPRHARAELVATEGDDVVGHVLLSRSWLDTRRALVEVLVLSPLSVAPDRQRQGLGTTLLRAALDGARALGAPAVFLEGDPGYYAERGFEPGAAHDLVRPSTRIPELAFQVALLEAHQPWMTGPLVYAEPFWELDCVGLRDPLLSQLEQVFDYRG